MGFSLFLGIAITYSLLKFIKFSPTVCFLQAIKGIREKVQLATKFGASFVDGKLKVRGDPAYVLACCEASLKRLDVDCIDLYYQHRIDTKVPIEVTVCDVTIGLGLVLERCWILLQ